MHSWRLHDLLKIDPEPLIGKGIAEAAAASLRLSRCVVVRRGRGPGIPVGIRGRHRDERWAATCQPEWVQGMVTPPQLLELPIDGSLPAFAALRTMKEQWKGAGLTWGPGGSVGFELATGVAAVTTGSDLDLIVFAARSLDASKARELCHSASGLAANVDIRVETPYCGFSLREYARDFPGKILLRTPSGVALGSDPWAPVVEVAQEEWAR